MTVNLKDMTRRDITLGPGLNYRYFSVPALEENGIGKVSRMPVSLRIVLESVLRNCDGRKVLPHHVESLANWRPDAPRETEIPFTIGRIVLNCAAGIPLLGDLTAIRGAMMRRGYPAGTVGPKVPVDMALDHTLTVDFNARPDALALNTALDIRRNAERYRFVKWAMQAYGGVRLFPPGAGILHQLNLELLAPGYLEKDGICYPDTLVGTDSHTCMIAGLGTVGWGVGGIEAEAAMLGQPLFFLTPDVVGVHVTGRLREGVTATDLVLHVTEMLRKAKVVGKFVEFFGEGVTTLSVPDRATIANMAVEYGATIGYFPVDGQTCSYLRQTGRSEETVRAVETLYRAQGFFGAPKPGDIDYSDVLELDLPIVVPNLAGPKRPQDRIPLDGLKERFADVLAAPVAEGGYGKAPATVAGEDGRGVRDGDVVIAAIASCTNTSNPGVMLAAGLVARNAVARGLRTRPWVKTSLTPGSMVVSRYLEAAGLQDALDTLGFAVAGYSCATCVGASGPIDPELEEQIAARDVVACAVLSGNRNFEARIHPAVRASFLASPPLVVAFALAGRMDIDLLNEPLGVDRDGRPVYLRDIWPTAEELGAAQAIAANPAFYRETYAGDIAARDPNWKTIPQATGSLYAWDERSTYLKEPPFLAPELSASVLKPVMGARALAILGDSVTTDHISPIGNIKARSPAGAYLSSLGVAPLDFNNFGARRMNHEVMVRGGFGNQRLRNLMVPGVEGGVTTHQPDGETTSIYEASLRYKADDVPLIVVAGQEYGTGSARDWAAKATRLLGVRAVVAESFERIHRSNLVGMGVLPCQLAEGTRTVDLGLDGSEHFDILGLCDDTEPGQSLTLVIHRADGARAEVPLILRLDTPVEVEYVRSGGVMPYILNELIAEAERLRAVS
ncbi:aconitate hydratase AcnA [Shinella yambaruensis]|uniref:Aconitate hydratase n=1 Tax=Shinella yambaruensis TaxID=415996 RepID=A0ABQ5ZPB7_9HYPH|nr:aconitate hydratase AcnA [Shinella yambaruensis]MCJ8027233.1 aconitate hydratase AcnA [Shinella yambaruensis]MCU7981289.1 aconitate hydratase AcnA [Shinella yambaruensis]GLR52554.1 aconitate hydratase [Shinella yambaruensis]